MTMQTQTQTKIKLVPANILTALDWGAIGAKVTRLAAFYDVAEKAVAEHNFENDRVPGQGFILVPEAVPFVSAGVGPKSSDPEHYVLREHRGVVSAYLKREYAAKTTGCALVVYTRHAYSQDPDVTPTEAARIDALNATHVLVAVLAFVGPEPPLSPYRLVWDLAGGNREAQEWSVDEIRAKAKASIAYDNEWSPVAD
jgi:hypothetical protein